MHTTNQRTTTPQANNRHKHNMHALNNLWSSYSHYVVLGHTCNNKESSSGKTPVRLVLVLMATSTDWLSPGSWRGRGTDSAMTSSLLSA